MDQADLINTSGTREKALANGPSAFDVATLAVQVMTPLAVVGLGLLITRASRRVESIEHVNRAIIMRRADIFELVAVKLNRLLCFATFVGTWKEITPIEALNLKRDIDETLYANRLIFSDNLFASYRHLMTCLFAMYATVGHDALLKVPIATQWGDRTNLPWWKEEMQDLFVPASQQSADPRIQQAFDQLASAWRADLYVTDSTRPVLSDSSPDGQQVSENYGSALWHSPGASRALKKS